MAMFLAAWTLLLLTKLCCAGKSVDVDVLASGALNSLQEEQILRVLSRNKTNSSNNFTLIGLVGNLRNHTVEAGKVAWKREKLDVQDTNPFYGESLSVFFSSVFLLILRE